MGCGIKRVIQLNIPIKYLPVKVFDESGYEISTSCMYAWSVDSVCWTDWATKDIYDKACKNMDSEFYLRILLFGGFKALWINSIEVKCYNISLYDENPFIKEFCGNENLFNPYANLDCALLLQQQLSDTICCMFGIPCYYFKVSPQKESADYTFKEYVLHNVDSVKIVKLMVEEGGLPSSNPQMNDFDFDWGNEWEVEISKNEFARAFGDTAYPKNFDFLYVPMMKRMYDVSGAYDEKKEGLMWRSTTWKLNLQKYNDSTNINRDDFDDIIDNFIVNNYQDTFGNKELVEQERTTGTTQCDPPRFAATNLVNLFLSDAVRATLPESEKANVIDMQLNHGSSVVTRNAYRFKESGEITYINQYCGESGTIITIITPRAEIGSFGDAFVKIQENILGLSKSDQNKAKLTFFDKSCDLSMGTTYLVMAKWNRRTYSTELHVYEHKTNPNIPKWQVRPEMYKFDFQNDLVNEPMGVYDNRLIINDKTPVVLNPYGCLVSEFKLYEQYLDDGQSYKESMKYTTTNKDCVINDIVRPIEAPHGYEIR